MMDSHHWSRKQLAASPEVAMANEVFDQFCNATTLKSILGHFRHLCDLLNMRSTNFPQFYPKFKSKLRSWKAQALWKKFDQRANHKCYNRGKACPNTRVLIIGGGPCGLRAAIEAQLLGAKVVVVEKRDRMSRNNVLHLWPFVIQDLRGLGAKKFFGKFCAGAIDHISIRQLQCILLKVALILGVEFHEGVSFDAVIPPPDNQEEGKIGWRAKATPTDHPINQYEFDVLIGADGKRNTLEGFKRKEFRGKLAIAITANFINKRTEAEARVEEISGVAFIFNQKFFKELYQETGIDLENIVYYKDDTHYFVMTAKKHSLIDKGVILQDHADTAKLLAKENVDRDALMLYAREAADFSTQYQMADMEFAVNHYGQPDVAMFDFTSMYAAENASRVIERNGHRLLMTLVGDSLLEPFWPTGSGCARGFLSSLDACWAIKSWGSQHNPLEVIAERESIYRLLGQTTPENLNRDYAAYTLDPHTRYPNLNPRSVSTVQVRGLLDTDDPESLKQPAIQPSSVDVPKKRRRRDTQIHPDTLLHWLQRQVALYDAVQITDMTSSFKDGLAICAIIHRYRPDLIDFYSLKSEEVEKNNQLAFDVLEKELGIAPIMNGDEMVHCEVPDKLAMFSYLTQIYEAFRGEIPHIKHPKLEPEADERPLYDKQLAQLTSEQKAQLMGRLNKHETAGRARHSRTRHNNENIQTIMDKKTDGSLGRRSRKRRSNEKMGASVDREPKMPLQHKSGMDEDFSGRIKNMEDKLRGTNPAEKKPRDLLRAIGKIEKTDWNVKEIEKKIEENKMSRGTRQDRERVPKWSREQFLARQIKLEKKGKDPNEPEAKYSELDNALKSIDRKIKEGNVLGHNKVSAMAEQFANKNQDIEPKVQRSNSKAAIVLPTQGGSEMCHFCDKRVYLMERLTAEGKFFHRGCFRCEYCSTSLRIGNHTFDREKNGGRFYCAQHFGLPGTMKTRLDKKKSPILNKENIPDSATTKIKATPEKSQTLKPPLDGVAGLDLLDRGQTPERIEFENLAGMSDAEEARSEMDEDEWTDRNFGASAAEMGSSDDISDMSDSDEDNEIYEEAIDQPLTTEGTIELAKNWTLRYSTNPHGSGGNSDTGSNEYEDSSDDYTSEDEESGTATEDEDEARARELRKQEVWLKVPPRESDDTETGSDTEVKINNNCQQLPLVDNSASSELCVVQPVIGNEVVLNGHDDDDDDDHEKVEKVTIGEELNYREENNSASGDGSSTVSRSRSDEGMGNYEGKSECDNTLPDLAISPKNNSNEKNLTNEINNKELGIETKEIDEIERDGQMVIDKDDEKYENDHFLSANENNLPDLITSSPDARRRKSILSNDNSQEEIGKKLNTNVEFSPKIEVKFDDNKPVPDSYDILKQELRLRREKKNADVAHLRPLSKETARSKMTEYFESMRQEKSKSPEQSSRSDNSISPENFQEELKSVEIQEIPRPSSPVLDIKPQNEVELKAHISNKIQSKDLLKYFQSSSFDQLDDARDEQKVERTLSPNVENLQVESSKIPEHSDSNKIEDVKKDSLSEKEEIPVPKPRKTDLTNKSSFLRPKPESQVKNHEPIQRISITEKEIILPKEQVTFAEETPKRPDRRRVPQDLISKFESNPPNESPKESEPELTRKCESNRSISSLKFGKSAKKPNRSDQEASKKDKCIIS